MVVFKDKTGKVLSSSEAGKKAVNRLFNYWWDFSLMLVRWTGCAPIHTFRKFVYRLYGMKIGRGSTVHMWTGFFKPGGVTVGKDSIVGDHCFLDGRAPLKIGDHVSIASQVLIYNSEHDINSPDFTAREEPVEIGDYVFIGPRAIILPGVKIGKAAVVAAGAVVTKDVPQFSVVAGVPAKEVAKRSLQSANYTLGRSRLFQ
jgi:maltose O-acetyltransferase